MNLRTAAILAAVLFLAACDEPVAHNTAPTLVITGGPNGVWPGDSATFNWQGSDVDGLVVGYRWWLDDSMTAVETESTSVHLSPLANGDHTFNVQARDDSGASSLAAVRAFRVVYDSAIMPRGLDTCLEVCTWNIQNFPKAGDSTIARVQAAILRMDLDIIGVEEIEDTLAFTRLLAGLPGYSGLWSRDDYGNFYQKTGFIYRNGMVTLTGVKQLFWSSDSVTRPPLLATATATHNGRTFDFKLIVMHLKAGSTESDFAQRRATCRLLKEYIDGELAQGGEQDFIVVGDWNDRLDDAPQYNAFQLFLDDSLDYQFLTWPFRSSYHNATHIGSGSVIDHLMITGDARAEYAGGRCETIRLDDEVGGYEAVISDHRPVAAWFPVFGSGR